jgi:plastocyanin
MKPKRIEMWRLGLPTVVALLAVAYGPFAGSSAPSVSASSAAPANAVPAVRTVAATDAATAPEVSIVEPPFKSPRTWTYNPAVLTVRVGTTVTWTNTGAVVHTVTADDRKTFNSGVMKPKATFEFAPSSPGTFAYHCTYHPWMKGTLVVLP